MERLLVREIPTSAKIHLMIRNLQLEFAHDWPWWAALLIVVVVMGTMALFYRRALRRVSRGTVVLLLVLRCVAMLALLLCIFRPTMRFQRGTITRLPLVVMVDRSRSMSIRDFDGQPSRFDQVTELLMRKDGVARELEESFETHWYVFDSRAVALDGRKGFEGLKPDGTATDLVTSAKDALGKRLASEVGGLVLLTDGIQTKPANPETELVKENLPVFTVGVGSILGRAENYRDIAIGRVDSKREVTVRTTLPIKVHVEAHGFPNRVMPVILKEDGEEVSRESVLLDNKRGAQKVVLHYTPQNKGDFELTIEIPHDPGERVTENNTRTIPIWVNDARIRVLYVEGVIRTEYRSVRRVLELDPQVEILSLLRTGANRFLQQGNIKDIQLTGFPKKFDELKKFKVLIIGSLEADVFSSAQMRFIERFVSEGGGLMMIGGKNAYGPGGYGGSPIAKLLPVEVGGLTIGEERESFPLSLTKAGANHPIFAGITPFFDVGSKAAATPLPEMRGCVRVVRAKPAAEVLATHPHRRNSRGSYVVIAAGRYGSGRVVASMIDSTCEWDIPMRGMGKESPFVRYWGQSMRWLAGSDDMKDVGGAHVMAYADKHYYEPGMQPKIAASVTDLEGQVTEKARVTIEVKTVDGEEKAKPLRKRLTPIHGRKGDYHATLPTLDPAKYICVVRAELDGKKLGEAILRFRVGEPTREFERLDLNEDSLQAIASGSGGRYLPLLSVARLPEIIRARQEKKIEKVELHLWHGPYLFIAFLLVITAEWVLRKQRLLS
jgi:uncharacterized membrane protein